MLTAEIRRRFLAHFAAADHTVVPSAPLLFDDPNLPETLSLFARLIGCIFYANLTPADH